MQGDGNFVIYNASGTALWATDTSGNRGAHLSLRDTGELSVVTAPGRTPLGRSRRAGAERDACRRPDGALTVGCLPVDAAG